MVRSYLLQVWMTYLQMEGVRADVAYKDALHPSNQILLDCGFVLNWSQHHNRCIRTKTKLPFDNSFHTFMLVPRAIALTISPPPPPPSPRTMSPPTTLPLKPCGNKMRMIFHRPFPSLLLEVLSSVTKPEKIYVNILKRNPESAPIGVAI